MHSRLNQVCVGHFTQVCWLGVACGGIQGLNAASNVQIILADAKNAAGAMQTALSQALP